VLGLTPGVFFSLKPKKNEYMFLESIFLATLFLTLWEVVLHHLQTKQVMKICCLDLEATKYIITLHIHKRKVGKKDAQYLKLFYSLQNPF